VQNHHPFEFGVVAIGRNEGERLKRCLRSLPVSVTVVYVDSGSTDRSDKWAREFGANVVCLELGSHFTAGRARNAGFGRLLEIVPAVAFVQFIDGDCELISSWPQFAISFLNAHDDVAAVFGRRRERYPDRSIYNRLCDWEWDGPMGEARAFGGDVVIRANALQAVGGYRESLIAGEEPELCVRLRAAGWYIWRLGAEMTIHDAAMLRFSQWWRRNVRSGYAFAEGASLHGAPPERHWVWESRRAWLWGVFLPLACLFCGLIFGVWGWASWLIYPLQIARQIWRSDGPGRHRLMKGFFQVLSRFPEGWGQIKFMRDHLLSRQPHPIEYK
jgi:glycosyltransferase involved in cell wall biosynthesis